MKQLLQSRVAANSLKNEPIKTEIRSKFLRRSLTHAYLSVDAIKK